EWLKYLTLVFILNAHSGIADLDQRVFTWRDLLELTDHRSVESDARCTNAETPAERHRIPRIRQERHHDLLELQRIRLNLTQFRIQVHLDLNLCASRMLDHVQQAGDGLVQI